MNHRAEDAPWVLVTGPRGGLGRALIGELVPGARIAAVDLEPAPAGLTIDRYAQGDICHVDWKDLVRGCAAVFHLAAFVHRRPESDQEVQRLYQVNHRATARLAEACRQVGAHLLFASSVAVFGATHEQVPGDETPLTPHNDYARSKVLAEDSIRAQGQLGLRYTILRFPLLYGPWGRGNMERLLAAIRARRYWPIGNPRTRKSCLHFSDAARALVRAWHMAPPRGGTYVVAPAMAPTLGQIHDAAYRGCNRRTPCPSIPGAAARVAAFLGDCLLRRNGRMTSLLDSVRTLTAPAEYDGSRFASLAGFKADVSLETGMAETLRWMERSLP